MGPGCREVLRKEASPPGTATATEVQRQEEDKPTSPCRESGRLGWEAIEGLVALHNYPRGPRAFPHPQPLRQSTQQVLPPPPYPSTLFKSPSCKSALHLQTKAAVTSRTTVYLGHHFPEPLCSFSKNQLHLPTSTHRRTGENVAHSSGLELLTNPDLQAHVGHRTGAETCPPARTR